MSFRILLLKTEKLSDFLKCGSKLFHSVMVDGKQFLKKLCFVVERLCYVYCESSKTSV